MPIVSILIPTYNGARHIRPAIDSVLAQDQADIELILVDDGSSDGTADIAESYSDPRIRIERNPVNLGAEGNWNRALELARGTYVKLLPQDDVLMPGSLARQVAVLEADADERIALAFGAREIIGDEGRRIMRRGLGRHRTGRIGARKLALECVRRGTNVIGEPGAVLFRRSLAERIGKFDGAQPYVIDLDYWLRLLGHGDAWYSAEPVSAFRVSGGSWSVRIGSSQSRQYGAFLDRMRRAQLIPASGTDLARGKAAAWLNNISRLIFYRLILR